MRTLVNAGREWGWAFAILLSMVSLAVFIAAAYLEPHVASTVGIDTGDTVKVVPREPGAQFQAAQFVCDPATKIQPGMFQPDAIGPILRFVRDGNQEVIEWSSAGYTNPTGTHYKPDNTSEDANFDAAAIKCARQLAEKAGIR